jgi:hypothetical protein
MSHRRNHYAVVLITGSSPDQDVNAVIKVHMEIMFAQKCVHDSNIHPRYATLWERSVTGKDVETRFQKVDRRRVIVALLASVDRQIGRRHMPRFY